MLSFVCLLFGSRAHPQGGAAAPPWRMSQHSDTPPTGHTAPCSVAGGPCCLEPRSAHGALSFLPCSPCSWPTCGVDRCVSILCRCWANPLARNAAVVPAATGDACEPANSCTPFACRLGGIFALIHARPLASVCGLQCSPIAFAPLHGHVRGLTMRKCAPGRV